MSFVIALLSDTDEIKTVKLFTETSGIQNIIKSLLLKDFMTKILIGMSLWSAQCLVLKTNKPNKLSYSFIVIYMPDIKL